MCKRVLGVFIQYLSFQSISGSGQLLAYSKKTFCLLNLKTVNEFSVFVYRRLIFHLYLFITVEFVFSTAGDFLAYFLVRVGLFVISTAGTFLAFLYADNLSSWPIFAEG